MTKRAGYVRNICAAVGVSLAISTGLASTAGAAPTTLPLTSFNDMVVDAQNEHVFVTGGLADQSVVVLDFQGNIITTIGNQNGAAGLVLDEPSSTLYVALRGSREISRINTTSLTELGRFSVAPAAPPRALASAPADCGHPGAAMNPTLRPSRRPAKTSGAATLSSTPHLGARTGPANEFAGDADHVGNVSPWRYFRVT